MPSTAPPPAKRYPLLYSSAGTVIVIGLVLLLLPALTPGFPQAHANYYQTLGALCIFLGAIFLAGAAGAYRPWRRSTPYAPLSGYLGHKAADEMMNRCPTCDAPNTSGTVYCVRCGRPMPPGN